MNAIYNESTNEKLEIRNTGLRVLSDVFALAATDLADNDQQRDLTVELLYSMDQEMVGTGGAYIDIRHLAWGEDFVLQQQFLLHVLEMAYGKHRWTELWYEPDEEMAQANIAEFKQIVANLKESEVSPDQYDKMDSYILCPDHRVLEHVYGCVICHNK